ncbi:hypothetical protein F5Y13DRAFT_204922 [Hypoxylon sp. FL1857]|nr:hypothetical protein F5Y13DRAFT_204922 [Hypoxylon sp. FL1857]
MPPYFFKHRTSLIVSINAALTFCGSVHFQAVKLYGPQYSGVTLLPMSLVGLPGAVVAALAITHWGQYKLVRMGRFTIYTLSLELFSLQNPNSTLAQWASYQCAEIRSVYSQAAQHVFQVSVAFAEVSFLLSSLEDEIVLRKTLDTEYGMKHENDRHNRANDAEAAEKRATSETN